MGNPVKNDSTSASAGASLGGNNAKGSAGLKGSAPISARNGANALQNVTRQLSQNPQKASNSRRENGNNPPNTNPRARFNRPDTQTQTQTGNRSGGRSEQNDRGQSKRTTTDAPADKLPRTESDHGSEVRKDQKPPSEPLNNRGSENPTDNFPRPNQDNFHRHENRSDHSLQNNSHESQDFSNHSEHGNNFLRTAVSQILQRSDVYLNNNALNSLINSRSQHAASGNQQILLPPQIKSLLATANKNLLPIFDLRRQTTPQNINQLARQFESQFKNEWREVRQFLQSNPVFEAKNFVQLNIQERMSAAIEKLLIYLPASAVEGLQKHPTEEILNGLLLARGLIVPREVVAQVINLLNSPQAKMNGEMPLTDLRDLGRLVKILIADAGASKTASSLDLAVQKFVRILNANNQFGILLAAVSIANQTPGNSISRPIMMVQIYELIGKLLEAGDRAMRQQVPDNSAKNLVQKDAKDNFLSVSVKEKTEKTADVKHTQTANAAGNLRQFLEFDPNLRHDKSISAFTNPDDARQAQQNFTNVFQHEIDDWLKSGNHRFVKDYNLDKPIGIVVERMRETVSNASQMRIVLVRDGSLAGWHFLKSFLVV